MSFRDDIKVGIEADHAENIKSDDPQDGTTKGVHNVSAAEYLHDRLG
jgi:hypothetical protein